MKKEVVLVSVELDVSINRIQELVFDFTYDLSI
jgi:hypothetical protein